MSRILVIAAHPDDEDIYVSDIMSFIMGAYGIILRLFNKDYREAESGTI